MAFRKTRMAVVAVLLGMSGMASAEEAEDNRAFVSFLLGAGSPGIVGGSAYSNVGTGIGLAIGYELANYSFEWRVIETYNLSLQEGADSFLSRGQLSMHSAGIRLPVGNGQGLQAEVLAGVALASVPVLVGGKGESKTELGAEDLHGVGAAVGASLGVELGSVFLSAELRGHAMVWQAPPSAYATDLRRAGEGISGGASTAAITAFPVTLSVGLRFSL